MKKRKIGIIGCVAEGKNMYDGQTISTRLLRDELCNKTKSKIFIVDTYNYKNNYFKIITNFLKCMFTCSDIIIMLSGNGLKVFLPMIFYINFFTRKHIYHRVIGGEIDSFIKKNPSYLKYLKSIKINWVQSKTLIYNLNKMGLNNVLYLENFRRITPISINQISNFYEVPFYFCTFSRVSKTKGITTAIKSIKRINQKYNKDIVKLDIYGPIEESYKEEFYNLLDTTSNISYNGCIESTKAVETLKKYYCNLFPTVWSGEGFPGALIDCFNAGLPIIATNWAYNCEYIKNGITGFIYNWQDEYELDQKIEYSINNISKIIEMKKNCLIEAKKYDVDKNIDIIIKIMDEG